MGFLDKVKNMFVEEYEDEEPIKKEEIQVKIEAPVKEEEQEEETFVEEEEVVIKPEKEVRTQREVVVKPEKIEPKKPLPTFFDDNDFEDFESSKKEIKKETIQPKREEYGIKKEEKIVKPNISGYNGKKEEDKRKLNFRPTPIISPVYGVLDKNYKKEEITSRKKTSTPIATHVDAQNVSVDDIRNKAFGTLEDELENNLSNREHLMFTAPKKEVKEIKVKEEKIEAPTSSEDAIDIFAELEKVDTLDQLLNSYEFADEAEHLESSLSRNYDNFESEFDDDKELNDSDLFNLIDSMYEKRDDK